MATHHSQELFLACSAHLPSSPSSASLPTSSKLELYGLYKVLTVGRSPPAGARPGFWDQAGRQKWDSWQRVGADYGASGEEGLGKARDRYVEIGRTVGFVMSEQELAAEATRERPPSVDLENLSEDEEGPSAETPSSGGLGMGGMGTKVSSLAIEVEGGASERSDSKPFSLISSTSTAADIRDYFTAYPSTDINSYSNQGSTLLHLAADKNLPSHVVALLELGADPSLQDRVDGDEDGMTALEMAELNGADWEEVRKLLAKAGDP